MSQHAWDEADRAQDLLAAERDEWQRRMHELETAALQARARRRTEPHATPRQPTLVEAVAHYEHRHDHRHDPPPEGEACDGAMSMTGAARVAASQPAADETDRATDRRLFGWREEDRYTDAIGTDSFRWPAA